jgi:hypothetical protein
MSGALTNDDIEQVAQALKYARAKLVDRSQASTSSWSQREILPSQTEFLHRRHCESHQAEIRLSDTPRGRYNVPANFLEVA